MTDPIEVQVVGGERIQVGTNLAENGSEIAVAIETTTAQIEVSLSDVQGVTDHGALTGLTDDDHSQYILGDRANWTDLTDGGATTLHTHTGGGGTTDHNALGNLQGSTDGSYYHLSSTDYAQLTGGGQTALHSHAGGGGRTLLQELTPAGSTAATSTDIPAGYYKITIEYAFRSTVGAGTATGYLVLNGNEASTDYHYVSQYTYGADTTATRSSATANSNIFSSFVPGTTSAEGEFENGIIQIIQYSSTDMNKIAHAHAGSYYSPTQIIVQDRVIDYHSRVPITTVGFELSTAFAAGSVARIYLET